jgi:hypothetical protein
MTKCPNCHNDRGIIHPYFGVLPCSDCQKRQDRLKRPAKQIEFVPDYIKNQRKEFAKDIVQPFRKGELSKEYIELYGTKRLKGVSQKEIKNAKNVWKSERYYE